MQSQRTRLCLLRLLVPMLLRMLVSTELDCIAATYLLLSFCQALPVRVELTCHLVRVLGLRDPVAATHVSSNPEAS